MRSKLVPLFSMLFLLVSLVSAENYTVYINDMLFPEPFEIESGDTVTWVNNDSVPHTVTDPIGYYFDSGNIAVGANWSYTFYWVGSNDYYCVYHPEMVSNVDVFVSSSSPDEDNPITPQTFNSYNSTQLEALITEEFYGLEMEWEYLTVYYEYTTLIDNWLGTINIFGNPVLEIIPTTSIVSASIHYEVIQYCYDEADNLGRNGGVYCTEQLITNLLPYDFDGIEIDTVGMQLEYEYEVLYLQLEELQAMSKEYVNSQTQNIMDIQLGIIGWYFP